MYMTWAYSAARHIPIERDAQILTLAGEAWAELTARAKPEDTLRALVAFGELDREGRLVGVDAYGIAGKRAGDMRLRLGAATAMSVEEPPFFVIEAVGCDASALGPPWIRSQAW